MPEDKGSRQDWIDWGRYQGMTVLLFPKGNLNPDYVLVQSTNECYMPSTADLSNFDFVSL